MLSIQDFMAQKLVQENTFVIQIFALFCPHVLSALLYPWAVVVVFVVDIKRPEKLLHNASFGGEDVGLLT